MEEKYSHFDLKKDIDLIGLGNAIVDIIVNVEDNFLEINSLFFVFFFFIRSFIKKLHSN